MNALPCSDSPPSAQMPRRPFPSARVVLLIALLCLAPTAFATPLSCGSYQTADGYSQLLVESRDRAVRRSEGMTPTPYLIQQRGQMLEVADLSTGFSSEYRLSADGKQISDRFNEYLLNKSAACKPSTPAAADSCRADIGSCIARASSATPAQLQQWCREDLPFACNQLLQDYQRAARVANETVPADPDLIEPAVCKENSAAFNPQACDEAAKEAMGKALAKMLLGGLNRSPAILAAPQLAELMQLCRSQPNGDFCSSVADAHWDAGQYLLAREALQLACKPGQNSSACGKAAGLAGLRDSDLGAAPANVLPCGDYRAAIGLMDELSFGDHGLVGLSLGSQLRARLENGQVHLRHDKGDDFVLQPLDGQRLLGIDPWNRYALYQREGGADHCSAPRVYVEVPLLQDCPSGAGGSGAQACCDAGRMQGCNAIGHQKALANDWQGAAPYYLKMCSAGLRAGCENLVSVYANTGDDHIPDRIAELCRRDPDGTHVACDIEATSNWPMLGLGAALGRAVQQIDNDHNDAADEPAPATHSNRKSPKK